MDCRARTDGLARSLSSAVTVRAAVHNDPVTVFFEQGEGRLTAAR